MLDDRTAAQMWLTYLRWPEYARHFKRSKRFKRLKYLNASFAGGK